MGGNVTIYTNMFTEETEPFTNDTYMFTRGTEPFTNDTYMFTGGTEPVTNDTYMFTRGTEPVTNYTYMFTGGTEPVTFRDDHQWWPQARSVVASVTFVTKQYLKQIQTATDAFTT